MQLSYWIWEAPADIDNDSVVLHEIVWTIGNTRWKSNTTQDSPKVGQVDTVVYFFLVKEQPYITIQSGSYNLLVR
ncbi:hypothetical protein G6F42_020256 [Rhizopus arrhizus]|nr:hypothetical protein G6F42_020256 [Rhizopus arrhizus]